jgi:hypothetical protein
MQFAERFTPLLIARPRAMDAKAIAAPTMARINAYSAAVAPDRSPSNFARVAMRDLLSTCIVRQANRRIMQPRLAFGPLRLTRLLSYKVPNWLDAGNYILEKADQMTYRVEDRPAALTKEEITRAMIAAGAAVLEEKAVFYSSEALASMVYTAMSEARAPSASRPS